MKIFIFFLFMLIGFPGFAKVSPGIEEILEIETSIILERYYLRVLAIKTKVQLENEPEVLIVELQKIISKIDTLDLKIEELKQMRSKIIQGYGCIQGRCIDGIGKYVYSNQHIYEGGYRSGELNGPGTLTLANKNFIRGEWKDNNLKGACEIGKDNIVTKSGICSYSFDGNFTFWDVQKPEEKIPDIQSEIVEIAPVLTTTEKKPQNWNWIFILIIIVFFSYLLNKYSYIIKKISRAIMRRNSSTVSPPSVQPNSENIPRVIPVSDTPNTSRVSGLDPNHTNSHGIRADGVVRDSSLY